SVVHGDGTKPYVLEDANIRDTDIAIALTSNDADNLMICQLCKTQFSIKRTVSVVSDPQKIEFFYAMGVDRAVCTMETVTSIIEQQAFINDITNIIPIRGGNLQIVEVRIDDSSPAVDKQLWEINLPSQVIIGCMLRGDTAMVPRGNSRILRGDTLMLIAGQKQEIPAIKILTGR
ncbi:MAG: potassium channel family protein, partial [Sphaerochaetaceae bacterium]